MRGSRDEDEAAQGSASAAAEPREPPGIGVRHVRGLEAQPEPGQRGAELVRRVGDEFALRLQRKGEPKIRHGVEGARDLCSRTSPPRLRALRDRPRRRGGPWLRDVPAAAPASPPRTRRRQGRTRARRHANEGVLIAADFPIERGHALGHAHGAGGGAAGLDDRHRGVEQLLVERLGAPAACTVRPARASTNCRADCRRPHRASPAARSRRAASPAAGSRRRPGCARPCPRACRADRSDRVGRMRSPPPVCAAVGGLRTHLAGRCDVASREPVARARATMHEHEREQAR